MAKGAVWTAALLAVAIGPTGVVPHQQTRATVEHIDQIARRALEKHHAAESAEEEGYGHGGCAQQRVSEFAVSAQRYRGQGPEHASQKAARKIARAAKRHLQVTSPYSYANTGDTLQRQTLETTWGPLRVVWETAFLYPTADN
eukprot:COSAG03_NODE_10085_length_673_cov_1.249129_1_plen_142_part_10